jgi:hypothetical protein
MIDSLVIIAARAVKPLPVANSRTGAYLAGQRKGDGERCAMAKLTVSESSELSSLEMRVEMALEAASAGRSAAPRELRELLIDALARLKALASGSEERPDAVETIERGLAALEAWQRWRPSPRPTA